MFITCIKIKLSKIKHIEQIAINALLLSSIIDQLTALFKANKAKQELLKINLVCYNQTKL